MWTKLSDFIYNIIQCTYPPSNLTGSAIYYMRHIINYKANKVRHLKQITFNKIVYYIFKKLLHVLRQHRLLETHFSLHKKQRINTKTYQNTKHMATTKLNFEYLISKWF